MKKYFLNFLTLLTINVFSNDLARSQIVTACEDTHVMRPIDSSTKAIMCIEYAIDHSTTELWNMALTKGHTGNLGDCAHHTATSHGSYFSNVTGDFNTSFGVTQGACTPGANDTWICSFSATHNNCYINASGAPGHLGLTPIRFVVGKTSGNIVSFYPAS